MKGRRSGIHGPKHGHCWTFTKGGKIRSVKCPGHKRRRK